MIGNEELRQVFLRFSLDCSNTFFLNRNFVLEKWSQIRTRSVIRPIQDIYNFFLNSNVNDLFDQIHNTIMSNQNSRFKINFSFGYILKNIESGALRFFHSSYNNHCVLNTAKLFSNSDELSRFLETTSEFDFLENFERPNTKWRYLSTTNITFYVNKLRKAVIGQSVT